MAHAAPARTLYLVDGTSQLYRAYFAIRGLSNAAGLPTNAVYGFTSMLRKLLTEQQPSHIAVAFDPPGPVFRHRQYAAYKANRPATPEDFQVQRPYAKRVCEVLGLRIVELPGYEADDVIATLAVRAARSGFEVVVVASDKDLLQLVRDGVRVYNPSKDEQFDSAAVAESFGVAPSLVADVLGLMGDHVDNIPGVPGVGEKTALGLVVRYGGLDAVIERAARFVAVLAARDRLLEALAEADGSLASSAAGLRQALEDLREVERDEPPGERIATLLDRLRGLTDPGAPPVAAADRASLVRELKGFERGGARRVWEAIHEHAGDARLSRQLAVLADDSPVPIDVEELARIEPDRARALELFRELGFRALVEEFAEERPPGPRLGSGETSVRHETLEDPAALEAWIAACRRAGRLAVGTVATGPDPLRAALLGVALAHAPGASAFVGLGGTAARSGLAPPQVLAALAPLLADETVAKLGHDTKASMHLLGRHDLPTRGWALDTSVAAFLLDSSRSSYALDRVASAYLGAAGADSANRVASTERLEFGDTGETVAAARAAELTLRLADRLGPALDAAGLGQLYRTIDGPLLPLLVRMESAGIAIDVGLLGSMAREMELALDERRAEIHRLAGASFNVDSPKQLREVLFGQLGLKPRRKTAKSKAASTDAQTLEELAEEHEIARKLLDYRELSKLKGTYVDALPRLVDPTSGRVHTRFDPTGAATGRLSSLDPNLQNIPVRTAAGRRIRAAFVPASGHSFLAADYSQIELRVLAHLCGDPALVGAFRAGADIHRSTAALVFGVAPDLVTDEMRRRAKAVNFGILYGMSETRLAREQGMRRADARRFIETYFERFAAVRGYIEEVRDRARREGAVRTLFGRLRKFPQLHEGVNRALQEQALRAAVNSTLQGTAADLMKLAMLEVERVLARASPGARILLQVHDELLIEVPDGDASVAQGLVRRAMEEVHPLDVPLVVDQKVGKSWLEVT